ncbi:MAG TPA: purine phosphorylase [Rhodospirillales bacterium]|nr:purine phosphorylase [Rhodospirillales bacterium]
MRLGVVTGLEREARCLQVFATADRPESRCRGPGPAAAAAAAAELLAQGCTALLSYGLAGGLDDDLRPGDIVVAEAVVAADGTARPTDPAWRNALLQRLAERGRRCVGGRLAGVDRPLLTPADKRACGRGLGAGAVDMESTALAQAAADAGLPFLAVRVVLDPLSRPIPSWLATTIDSRGEPRLSRVLAGLAANPLDLPALLRLARDERTAMPSLCHLAVDAGPRFGLA